MVSKRKLIVGGVFFVVLILTISILINSFFPFLFDRKTYNNGYGLENAFPNLTFSDLVYLTNDGNQNLYAVEQTGMIYKFTNDQQVESADLFVDISDRVACCGERGLLGLTFDPSFSSNGYFYVDYTADNPLRTVISRFTVTNGVVNLNSELIILQVNQPYSNHNAGFLTFGPDGMLYLTFGDGGSGGDPQGNGQNLGTLLGSIARIDVTNATATRPYKIPSDNPFVNHDTARGEIWAYGLRNPWRMSFDSETGDLWVGDVGQNNYEEVDLIQKGQNYGWNTMEGMHCYSPQENCNRSGLTLPIVEYNHTLGNAIIGGYVYRGSKLPNLVGKYIFADYGSGRFWYLSADKPNEPHMTDMMKYNFVISGFGVDANNELYVLHYSEGSIYKVVAVEP